LVDHVAFRPSTYETPVLSVRVNHVVLWHDAAVTENLESNFVVV